MSSKSLMGHVTQEVNDNLLWDIVTFDHCICDKEVAGVSYSAAIPSSVVHATTCRSRVTFYLMALHAIT